MPPTEFFTELVPRFMLGIMIGLVLFAIPFIFIIIVNKNPRNTFRSVARKLHKGLEDGSIRPR